MRSTAFIITAAALISGASASPANSRSKSIRSTASCQSVEAQLESNNAFSDQVAVLGDVKLLIDNSESILNDMDTRLTRLGVDKHVVRHRSLDRRDSPSNDTGKLVPIAELAEKIQKGINSLTELILDIECPRSLPLNKFTSCVAAQDEPLQRLRNFYPAALDWAGDHHEDKSIEAPAETPINSRDSHPNDHDQDDHYSHVYDRPHARPQGHHHGHVHGHPQYTTTTVMVPASTISITTSTSTLLAASTTTVTADVSSSETDTLSFYTTSAANSSFTSSATLVGNSSSTLASASAITPVNVTIARSTATSAMNTTSRYTTSATMAFTMTTETTFATTGTAVFNATQTASVMSTSNSTSVIDPSTVRVGRNQTSRPPPNLRYYSSKPSFNASRDSGDASYRTVWMPTSRSPYMYGTRTHGVPSAPPGSSSGTVMSYTTTMTRPTVA